MISQNIEHKTVTNYESIQVIFPYEIWQVKNALTGEALWVEVRPVKYAPDYVDISPRAFLSTGDARDYIIQQITHKHEKEN